VAAGARPFGAHCPRLTRLRVVGLFLRFGQTEEHTGLWGFASAAYCARADRRFFFYSLESRRTILIAEQGVVQLSNI